jgi:uncharacterized protein YjbJ (UPF0337 family)
MNRDQKEGAFQNLKGRIKQAAGALTGDKEKEAQGASERATGGLKKAFGDFRHKFSKKLDQ